LTKTKLIEKLLEHKVVDTDLHEHAWYLYKQGPWDFVEFFAGHAGLTSAANKVGLKSHAVEAYHDNVFLKIHDLENIQVQAMWICLAKLHCIKWAHFGIICKIGGLYTGFSIKAPELETSLLEMARGRMRKLPISR